MGLTQENLNINEEIFLYRTHLEKLKYLFLLYLSVT